MNDRWKFRVWDKSTDPEEPEMIYYEPQHAGRCFEYHFFLGDPIMQCTGLHDKNGKLIYESDVIKSKHGIHAVLYEHGFWKIDVKDKSKSIPINKGINDIVEHEVLGNIYENPDLL